MVVIAFEVDDCWHFGAWSRLLQNGPQIYSGRPMNKFRVDCVSFILVKNTLRYSIMKIGARKGERKELVADGV